MSGFSSAGKAKYAAWGILFVVNIVALALSARINQFQDFFYVADLFPLALSAITLSFIVILTLVDFTSNNAFTARPAFDLAFLFVGSILWMSFNAFSTARWAGVPMACGNIPDDFADERAWCSDVQALKAVVWVEWVGFLLTALLTLRYVLAQNSAGRRHIWRTPLSRFTPVSASAFTGYPGSSAPVDDIYTNNTTTNNGGYNADLSGHMAFNGAPATTAFEQQFAQNQDAEGGRQYQYQPQQPSPMAGQYRGQTGYGATAYASNQYGGNAY